MHVIARSRMPLAAVLVFIVALGLATGAQGSASRSELALGHTARAGSSLYRAFQHQRRVPVLIALRPIAAGRSLAARTHAITAMEHSVAARLTPSDFSLRRRLETAPILAGRLTRSGLAKLLSAPEVVRIDRDPVVRGQLAQSVPLIHADQVQAQGVSGAGVTVAVLDTGIDVGHPALSGHVVAEQCFLTKQDGTAGCPNGRRSASGPGSAADDDGHGTNVAGIISASGASGASGVAPGTKIVDVKVLPKENKGSTSDVLAALDWIVSTRPEVKVVNMSLGSDELFAGDCDRANAATIGYASLLGALKRRGVATFVASGNGASASSMAVPGCVSTAISVGAVYDGSLGSLSFKDCDDSATAADQITCFSNAGSTLDLLAPGGGITAPARGGATATFFGTSQASPHAAGVAALLLEARPSLTPDQLERLLEQTGVSIRDPRNGLSFPRIDALAAYDALSSIAPPPAGPTYLPALNLHFPEGAGDAATGPDLGAVQVSSSGTGILTFIASLTNRSSLQSGESVQLFLDGDENASTGSAGADYAISAFATGEVDFFRWSGSWEFVRLLGQSSLEGGTLRAQISEDELGIAGGFSFRVTAFVGSGASDSAPASGVFPYPAVTLSVSLAGSGSGTVSAPGGIECGTDCSALYRPGTSMTLAAAPARGSLFAGWGGACSGAGSCTLKLDSSTSVSASFERDRSAPVVHASTGAAKRGRVARLRFRVSDNSGQASEQLRILRGRRALATLRHGPRAATGNAYAESWHVPKKLKRGALRFCVVARDAAGNSSRPSCAGLRVS